MPSNNFLRFCIVGAINTLIDVPTFVLLHSAGLSILFANIISTTIALIVSLVLNYRFTFRNRSLSPVRIALYFVVTLVGIWVLQPLVISGLLITNNHIHLTNFIIGVTGHADQVNSLLAKLASLSVSLVWNYLWYSRIVFREEPKSEQLGRALEL